MAGEITLSSCLIFTFLWHLVGESLKKRIFLTMHKFEGQLHGFLELTLIELDLENCLFGSFSRSSLQECEHLQRQ